MKVGRSALDETAIREIEEHNPEIEFDWTRILKGQGAPEPPPVQERRKRPRDAAYAQREAARPPEPTEPTVSETGAELADETAAIPDVEAPEPVEIGSGPDVDAAAGLEPPLAPALTQDELVEGMDEPIAPPTPAHARLGSEGVARLRGRHAEILARISERVPDPVQREELKSVADRLNPDTWVTEDEVREGLERYEAVLDSLRAVVGQRRRRRRRGHAAASGPSTPPAVPEDRGGGE